MSGNLTLTNFERFQALINSLTLKLKAENIVKRIWARDYTVWKNDPAEISNRLGWLDSPENMESGIPEISDFADNINYEKIPNVLLMGMGGSSLAAEFFGSVKIKDKSRFNFDVIDSTHPGVVKRYSDNLDPSQTLYIASTKSGGTAETISLLKYFYNLVRDSVGKKRVGAHFVAITDPGSGLEKIARENGFHKIFLNDPDIGGRFSALSYFGLVPAALNEWNISSLLERARQMSEKCRREDKNPGFFLGVLIGWLAVKGLNKPTIILPESSKLFGAWIEQLIAESTGKDGKGVLPIVVGDIGDICCYADDRYLVLLKIAGDNTGDEAFENARKAGIPAIRIDLEDLYDFGEQFFMWEFATAVAGHMLKINPFNQPDVESAKSAAAEMVNTYRSNGKLSKPESITIEEGIDLYKPFSGKSLKWALESFFKEAKNLRGSYISIQAYLDPVQQIRQLLDEFKTEVEKKLKLPVTVGFGPRYLHSTGQLHKGDSGKGFFIQLMEDYEPELLIPDDFGRPDGSIAFGALIKAQCIGDRKGLLQAKRNVLSIRFNADTIKGLERLISGL
ncbi:MAG: hypothetical protein JSU85_09725 [Candidatus Zixiibacteriota bacterium]|nr:MAG: hypothetical protein JSU85_09725 [candidate division Zixibacteria bacterium]